VRALRVPKSARAEERSYRTEVSAKAKCFHMRAATAFDSAVLGAGDSEREAREARRCSEC
jgi:hypothetical protein